MLNYKRTVLNCQWTHHRSFSSLLLHQFHYLICVNWRLTRHSGLFTFYRNTSSAASDLIETKKVGVMRVTEEGGVRHLHVYSVMGLQLQSGGQVALCGPGARGLLRAETRSVGLHQGQRGGPFSSPHKHRVEEERCGGAVFEDQLHPRVNVVESRLVDPQGSVFKLVRDPPRGVRPAHLWHPP